MTSVPKPGKTIGSWGANNKIMKNSSALAAASRRQKHGPRALAVKIQQEGPKDVTMSMAGNNLMA